MPLLPNSSDIDAAREELRQADRRNDFSTVQDLSDASPALGREWAWRRVQAGAAITPTCGRPLVRRSELDWFSALPEMLPLHVCGVVVVPLWDDSIARLFACDCAEDVLPIYEAPYPGDLRPRQAIEVARRYAAGLATASELDGASAAASDAASAAARSAARSAVRAAARAAASAARTTAWTTARAAAWAAASAAAWAAVSAAADVRYAGWLAEYLLTGGRA